MKKKVLILTHQNDPHAFSVREYLDQIGIKNFTIVTETFLRDCKINFSSRELVYSVEQEGEVIHLDSSWNIWNRRVMIPDREKGIPKDLQNLVIDECEKTWDNLLISHPGKVVNRPQNHFYANNKLDQIKFALQKGILVPDTIVTTDPSKLREFYELHGGNICFKLQKGAVVRTPEGNKVVYTNKVTNEQMKHASLVSSHPSLFQEYIDKDFEVRVISTDRTSTGIAIHSQDSEISKVDYRRYDLENVRYHQIDLPPEIRTFCSDMLQHYGLHFGAFDFIYSKNGRYCFLELNPNGQWLWLQEKSGYDLTKEIAENLIE